MSKIRIIEDRDRLRTLREGQGARLSAITSLKGQVLGQAKQN
jgi:hypothetical protein